MASSPLLGNLPPELIRAVYATLLESGYMAAMPLALTSRAHLSIFQAGLQSFDFSWLDESQPQVTGKRERFPRHATAQRAASLVRGALRLFPAVRMLVMNAHALDESLAKDWENAFKKSPALRGLQSIDLADDSCLRSMWSMSSLVAVLRGCGSTGLRELKLTPLGLCMDEVAAVLAESATGLKALTVRCGPWLDPTTPFGVTAVIRAVSRTVSSVCIIFPPRIIPHDFLRETHAALAACSVLQDVSLAVPMYDFLVWHDGHRHAPRLTKLVLCSLQRRFDAFFLHLPEWKELSSLEVHDVPVDVLADVIAILSWRVRAVDVCKRTDCTALPHWFYNAPTPLRGVVASEVRDMVAEKFPSVRHIRTGGASLEPCANRVLIELTVPSS